MDEFIPHSELEPSYEPLSIADWLVTLLLSFVPILNVFMYLFWAFGTSVHPSKKNWAKANLIIWTVLIIISIFFFSLIFGGLIALLNEFNQVEMGT